MLLVLVLIILLLLFPGFLSLLPQIGNSSSSVAAPQNLSPPSSSPEFNLTGVEVFYSEVLQTAAQTLNATNVISNYPIETVPSQYQGMILLTNQIIQNLTNQLRAAGSQYKQAFLLEELGNYENSSNELSDAYSYAQTANSTLISLNSAFERMDQSGIPTNDTQSGVNLLEARLFALVGEISSESSLVQKIENGVISPTKLTLKITPSTVKIGEKIFAFGSLFSNSSALPNEQISIAFSGYTMGSTQTNSSGMFQFDFSIPKNYATSANITATFAGGSYAPAMSIQFVSVSLYTPRVIFTSIPQSVVPGQSYELNGNISVTGSDASFPAPQEIFYAYALGQVSNITYLGTMANQTFSLKIFAGNNVSDGTNLLVINSSGDQNYSPLRARVAVDVIREAIYVKLSYPWIANPFSSFKVTGQASYGPEGNSTPLSDGYVVLSLGSQSVRGNLNAQGTFSLTIKPPLSTMLRGAAFSVSVMPGESTIDSYSSTRSFEGILTDPDVSTIGLLVFFFAFVILYYVLLQALFLKNKNKKKTIFFPKQTSSIRPNEKQGESST